MTFKSLTMIDRSVADFSELGDPIELVARFVVQQDWFLKQTHADGVLVDVPGQWGRYQMRVDWKDDLQVLCVHVMLDLLFDDVPAVRLETLLSDLNENLFLGHFRLSSDKRQVQLYYVLPLRGQVGRRLSKLKMWLIFSWDSVSRLPLLLPSLSLPLTGQHRL